ncbi:MAG: alpha/beta hydrolase [Armatimonadetes bacterium]|nr:alpha/beta hydrolase [Armatimonadota bacterium]
MAQPAPLLDMPGEVDVYEGYLRHTFTLDGCRCLLVEPRAPRADRAWVWKAEFFEAFPAFELAMLQRGFFLAYITVGNTFGCPSALAHWSPFYEELTGKYGLSSRPILLGMSRGGLYIYNWAARNPSQVGCLYGDAPVCDFKSWPGGRGVGPGSPADWEALRRCYGFASEAEALAYGGNPVDNLAPIAAAGLPIIHVVGDRDEPVPVSENSDVLEARYRALGGLIQVIHKPECGHHPHGLEDPAPVIEFILQHALGLERP